MLNISNQRDQLLHSLQGQVACIPDLKKVFEDWPGITSPLVNPCRGELTHIVNERLTYLKKIGAIDDRTLKGLKAADFAHFTALWWPEASLERARTLAFFVIWIFTWDDEVDEPSGCYAEDMRAAENFRHKTEEYIRRSLGLEYTEDCLYLVNQNYQPIVRSFREIGDVLRDEYTLDQRLYFYRELERYMHMTRREQNLRLAEQVPSLAEYWDFRLGTSAVELSLAAGELANDTHIPEWTMQLPSMKALWEETNVIISAANDLFSLRKEVENGCIDNAVAMICGTGVNTDAAVAAVLEQIVESKERFEAAVLQLQQDTEEDMRLSKDVARFIYVCRTSCTGNIIWSLETPRYALSGEDVLKRDGWMCFTLQTLQTIK